MLAEHINWNKKDKTDNLMSWTSSFMFAMQHAQFRLKTDYEGILPRQIYFLVINTRSAPPRSFLPAVPLLKSFELCGPDWNGRLRHPVETYIGEYLSQGRLRLDGMKTVLTTYDALVHEQIYRIYPDLENKSPAAAMKPQQRLSEWRTDYRAKKPASFPEASLDQTLVIVQQCFNDDEFRAFMLAVLMSLQPRPRLDTRILLAFRRNS